MVKKRTRYSFWLSTWNLIMGLILVIACNGVFIYLTACLWRYIVAEVKMLTENINLFNECNNLIAMMFLGLISLCETYLVLSRYELCGRMTFTSEELILRAPFRSTKRLRFDEIKYIGIDYGVYSGVRHFWIFFRKEPIPLKYQHQIHKETLTKDRIRIEYDKKIFDKIISSLPPKLGKQLSASYSVIRAYNAE